MDGMTSTTGRILLDTASIMSNQRGSNAGSFEFQILAIAKEIEIRVFSFSVGFTTDRTASSQKPKLKT